jgi:hypothetical protein
MRTKSVPYTKLGQEVAGSRWILFNFFPNLIHKCMQVGQLITVIRSPDALQDLSVRNGYVGMSDQVMKQIKFLGREPHISPTHANMACVQIDLYV